MDVRRVRSAIAGLLLALPAGPVLATHTLTIASGLIPWKGVGGPTNLALRQCYEEFLAAHPEVELAEYRSLQLPGVHAGAAQMMSLAAGAGPDITIVPFSFLANLVREGIIRPVDDLFEAWPERDYWPESLMDDLKIDGHRWCAVLAPDLAMLGGNAQLFKNSGLSEAAMPRTWQELAALVPRLSRGDKWAGFAVTRTRMLGYLWLALARQAGGGEVVRITDNGVEVDLEAEPSRKAAELLRDIGTLIRANPSSSLVIYDTDEEFANACTQGKVALTILSQPQLAYFGTAAYVAPPPGGFGPEPLAYAVGGGAFVMPAYLRSPAVRSLIWEFQTSGVWTGKKVDAIEMNMAAASGDQGLRPMLAARYPDHPAAKLVPAGWRTAMEAVRGRARPMPPDLEFEEFAGILGPRLSDLLGQGGDPVAVLRDARAAFDGKVHQWARRKDPKWKFIGWAVLGLFAGLLVWSMARLVWALSHEVETGGAHGRRLDIGGRLLALGLFAPAVGLAAVFGVVPLLNGLRMSLSSHVLREGGTFVGLANYFDVIINPLSLLVVKNTLVFLGMSFALGFVLPLLLALVLADFPWRKELVRTLFFMPAVCSAVVLVIIWQQLYKGPVNVLMAVLGLPGQDWLHDPATAMFAVVLPQAWANLGVSGLIYFAGLATIPKELYEEAEMAGAGLLERFRSVTLPYLFPLIGVSFVGWGIGAARTSEHVFLMTGAGRRRRRTSRGSTSSPRPTSPSGSGTRWRRSGCSSRSS